MQKYIVRQIVLFLFFFQKHPYIYHIFREKAIPKYAIPATAYHSRVTSPVDALT